MTPIIIDLLALLGCAWLAAMPGLCKGRPARKPPPRAGAPASAARRRPR